MRKNGAICSHLSSRSGSPHERINSSVCEVCGENKEVNCAWKNDLKKSSSSSEDEYAIGDASAL